MIIDASVVSKWFVPEDDIAARLVDLRQIVDIVEGRTGELAVRALEIAISLDHAIYDGVYLALAEADGDVLLTADDAFRRKVERTDLADHIKGFGA